MTENEMLSAIRSRFINSFIQQGKDYFELVIVQKAGRIIAEFDPTDSKRMYELTMTYGVSE